MTENLPHGTLDVVTFVADGHRFAVEAAQVRTQLPAGEYDSAYSAENILGLPCNQVQNPLSRRVLLMKCSEGDYAVTVSEPVELRSLDISVIYPVPSLVAARSTLEGLRGLAMESDGVTLLVNLLVKKLPLIQ